MRSCYSSTWRFPETGDADVRGYYYFTREPVRFYPGWSYFGSRNWHQGDGTPWPEFGEKEGVRQQWRDGSFPVRQPDARIVGSAECIEGLNVFTVHTPPTTLIHGVDIRCWQTENPPAELVGLGGGKLNTSATTSSARHLLASGGGRLNSSGTGAATHTLVATGGGKLDAAADTTSAHALAATGGAKGNSTASSASAFFLEATGGAAGNTSADAVFTMSALIFSEVASKTVGNTGTETTLLTTSGALVSSQIVAGSVVKFYASGTVRFQNVATQTCTYRLKFGGTTVAGFVITSTNAGPVAFECFIDVLIRTTGSPGTAQQGGFYAANIGTITVTTHQAINSANGFTTGSNPAIDFTAQWNTGALNNTTTLDQAHALQF